ncbi:MAG: DNA internalization-related competence protein ComEC/Rec2 [Kofleriaceae bacterium]
MAEIVHGFGRKPGATSTDISHMPVPRPLTIAFALAAGLATLRAVRGRPVSDARADDRKVDRITGVVDGLPMTTPLGFGAPLATRDGEVWLWTTERVDPGDLLSATGRLRTPRGMLDPGAPPPPDRGVLEMTATSIDHAGRAHTLRLNALRWAAATQRVWDARIDDATEPGDAGAGALRGIVTGDRGTVPPALDQRWRACGIYHVLSVSGLHLAVIAGLAFMLLRRLAAASPWGGRIRPGRWAAPPALLLAIAYTLVTGAQLATLRSLVVIAIMLIAQFLARPMRLIDALGLAAIGLLLWRPGDLTDPSFQLSFAAALALALRPRAVPAFARDRRVVRWLVEGIVTSAWVSLVTAPLTAYHFHQVQPGGVLGNLFLTPVLELVALPLGLAGLLVGAVWSAGGAVMLRAAAWVVGRVDDLAGVLARLTPVGTITVASVGAMIVLVALALWLLSRERRTRLDALAFGVLVATWLVARTPPPPGALRVTFLDVGQGDAAIVELPNGAAWIVDAGGLASRHDLTSAAAPGRTITRALEAYGHASVELAIISHPHPDHYLGLASLDMPIAELWAAEETEPAIENDRVARVSSRIPSFSDLARSRASIHHPPLGLARSEAGVELWVWAPRLREREGAPEHEAADPVRTVNDNSLVIELRFAGRSIVFAGDVEAEGEAAVVAAGLGAADIVKVAHHGSPTSSSPGFVAATHPSYAVISCGVANSFGFPSPRVVAAWQAVGAEVDRTDTGGAITATVTADGDLSVDQFQSPVP